MLVTGGVTLTGEEVSGIGEAQEEEEEEEEEEEDLLSQAMSSEEQKFMCGVSGGFLLASAGFLLSLLL